MNKRISGFTLIELMITVTIVGIMAAIAFPSMRSFVVHTRIINRAEQISNLMRFAKTEAMRRNVPVIVCGTRVRSDGRPSGVCDAAQINSGLRAFADMNRNGQFDAPDINLRTININGNGEKHLHVVPNVYSIDVKGGIAPTPDNLSQFVFMPNGMLGRKTMPNSYVGLAQGQNYVRLVVAENTSPDKSANSNNQQVKLDAAQKSRAMIVALNPSGKVNTCRDHNKTQYEQAAVCSL